MQSILTPSTLSAKFWSDTGIWAVLRFVSLAAAGLCVVVVGSLVLECPTVVLFLFIWMYFRIQHLEKTIDGLRRSVSKLRDCLPMPAIDPDLGTLENTTGPPPACPPR